MFICKYCSKECKNNNSLINHERLCKYNPNRQKTIFSDINWQKNKTTNRGTNQYIKAKLEGKPKPQMTDKGRLKLSIRNKNRSKEFNKSVGIKISKTIQEKISKGTWHISLARNMHYNYNGIDLHGKWELEFAKYLDNNKIEWRRPSESFEYIYEGKKRKYTPDFYLINEDLYIEIKGYKTSKDEAKWSQFPKKLKIIFGKELKYNYKLNIDL